MVFRDCARMVWQWRVANWRNSSLWPFVLTVMFCVRIYHGLLGDLTSCVFLGSREMMISGMYCMYGAEVTWSGLLFFQSDKRMTFEPAISVQPTTDSTLNCSCHAVSASGSSWKYQGSLYECNYLSILKGFCKMVLEYVRAQLVYDLKCLPWRTKHTDSYKRINLFDNEAKIVVLGCALFEPIFSCVLRLVCGSCVILHVQFTLGSYLHPGTESKWF